MNDKSNIWQTLDTIAEIKTKWVTIHVEEMLDADGNKLEYWHYDRADSAVVIVRQGDQFVLPKATYRPGVREVTLDFVGGRIPEGMPPVDASRRLIEKELGISQDTLADLTFIPINPKPWFVDSSFSSQKIYGFYIDLPADIKTEGESLTAQALYDQLECLQCRGLFLALQHRLANGNS